MGFEWETGLILNNQFSLAANGALVMNYFNDGEVRLSPRGSLMIGKITMQRKGGDGGRPSANMLQFKINPAELFDL